MKIVTIENKKDEKFLREKTVPFVFEKYNQKAVNELVTEMRKSMKEADGIGLSANQIGYNFRVFVAQVPDTSGAMKFYAVFNPTLEKFSSEKLPKEEGCLSVPGIYGSVLRHEKVMLLGEDKNGKKIKIKAWGHLAHVFQHEVDHLNGILFIDKARGLHTIDMGDKR